MGRLPVEESMRDRSIFCSSANPVACGMMDAAPGGARLGQLADLAMPWRFAFATQERPKFSLRIVAGFSRAAVKSG